MDTSKPNFKEIKNTIEKCLEFFPTNGMVKSIWFMINGS